jgi:hypothetical protein
MNDFAAHSVRVSVSSTGGIVAFMNGTAVSQFAIPGSVVSVFGANGKFAFEMNNGGQMMSKHAVAFLKIDGVDVAVPVRPLTTPSKFERLTPGLPALPGMRAVDSDESYSPGIKEVRRPFFDFFSMRPGADPNRPADQMIDTLEKLVVVSPGVSIPYWIVSLVLFATFLLIRFVEIILERLVTLSNSSLRILPDASNPAIATFNGVPCSVVRSQGTSEAILRRLTELNIAGIAKVNSATVFFSNAISFNSLVYPF